MKIVTTDKYDKKYEKLSANLKNKVDYVLERFIKNPLDPSLLNHNLQGRMKGFKSIKVGMDLRMIFKEEKGYTIVVMVDLGKHDDVYL